MWVTHEVFCIAPTLAFEVCALSFLPPFSSMFCASCLSPFPVYSFPLSLPLRLRFLHVPSYAFLLHINIVN
jgi:hypothetical protein